MNDFTSIQPESNRTDFEVVVEELGALRTDAIPIPIRDADDHEKIIADALPFLAWERTVGVWDDNWPEWLKRKAIGKSIYLRQRTGTLEAYEGWLDLLGANVVDVVAPPGGCFATSGQTKEQRLEFLKRFAQLRITLRRSPGPGDAGTFYASPYRPGAGDSFIGSNFAVPGTARQRYGRKATVVDQGVETEVIWSTAGKVEVDGILTPVERITVPGIARSSEPFVGAMFLGAERSFAEPFETTSRILTLGPDRSPQTNVRMPLIERPANDLDVVSIKPERVSEGAETVERPMMVDGFIGDFLYINTAAERYYDRFYLFDEDRVPISQTTSYGTFIGYSWTEISPFTAELRVHYPGTAAPRSAYVGGIVGMFPEPSSGRLARIATAVRAGKSARDKIFFTAQTKRSRSLEDGIPLDGTYRLGDLIDIARGSA
ncbi:MULTISPECIES: phage tail protein I [Agrobacterium]|nr:MULTISPECIES: phage tail protein I [Agrobacterium]MDA5627775.1 phage tail protein I [Agrobacterium sp. ST15.16.055]MDA6978477.1 phage tail protein I [Agrobacterium salinitolerans]